MLAMNERAEDEKACIDSCACHVICIVLLYARMLFTMWP